MAFPPHATPRFASNLQRPFDPLGEAPADAVNDASRPSRGLVFALILARVLLQHSASRVAEELPSPTVQSSSTATALRGPDVHSKPLITYQRRRFRTKATRDAPKPVFARRTSSRLAAKAPAGFIDMTSQAMQRKALLNSLSSCSLPLKKFVAKRGMLSRNKLPISARDLRLLTSAVGLDAGVPDTAAC